MKISFHNSIEEISRESWDALIGDLNYPFLKHDFLKTLEITNCVGTNTGWIPIHITLKRGEELIAAMPPFILKVILRVNLSSIIHGPTLFISMV